MVRIDILDKHRRAVFEARGIMELRFGNEEVINDIDLVIQKITAVTMKRMTSL